MRIMSGHGGVEIYHYEVGDLVRLCRDEDGPLITAFAGDWGRVLHVHPDGSLDIKFAGSGRARDATLTRATAVHRSRVEPCDDQGRPRMRGTVAVWDTRKAL
ncbi:hypothetical protein [Falsiroseomonas sp. HW251]|uniref:hypothetical protein n=1 Tax=Falsiroseomonas sp. HW251 TaxID=3390998 RepID=UPI003D30F97D